MSFGNLRQLYFPNRDVFYCSFLSTSYSFLTQLHYLQKQQFLSAEICIEKSLTGSLPALYAVYLLKQVNSPASTRQAPHAEYTRPLGKQALNLRITSPAGCSLTYLRFADEFNRGVIALLHEIAGIFKCNCAYFFLRLRVFLHAIAGISKCNCAYFFLRLRVFLLFDCVCFCLHIACVFAGKIKHFCMPVVGELA